MIPNKAIVDALRLYGFCATSLEVRQRTGRVLPWPAWVRRPDGVPDAPTELDVAAARDGLCALLGPDDSDSDEGPEGPWLRLDSSAPANRVLAVVDGRVRQDVARLVPEHHPTEEHDDE
jgi:hypothetical protein